MAQMKVNGSIVSQSDGQPIIGATIMVSGTQIGTTSDLDGQFSLTVPEGKSTLKISYVGMETLEVSARPNMKIALTGGGNSLDEIIVTGYGVTRKAAFTGAATSVDTKTIANKTDANPIKALDGAVPGLHLTMESGQPGAPATIFIRGRNSLNSSTQPLYVVDGVPYTSDVVGIRSDEGQEISPLASLNANDIDAAMSMIAGTARSMGIVVED